MQNYVRTESQNSGGGAAQTLTVAAVTGAWIVVKSFEVYIKTADVTDAVSVVLKSGTATRWETGFGAAATVGDRVGMSFGGTGMSSNVQGEAVTIEVSAPGGATVTVANIAYEYIGGE